MKTYHTFTSNPPAKFRIYAGQFLNCPHGPNTTVCCDDCRREYPQIIETHDGGCIWLTPMEHASLFPFMYTDALLMEIFGTPEYAQTMNQLATARIKGTR